MLPVGRGEPREVGKAPDAAMLSVGSGKPRTGGKPRAQQGSGSLRKQGVSLRVALGLEAGSGKRGWAVVLLMHSHSASLLSNGHYPGPSHFFF